MSDWANVFVRAAWRLQAGESLYVRGGNYPYPPAMAMLSMPLANLSRSLSLVSWYLVNAAAAALAFVSAWRLAGGPALVRLPRRWQTIFWLGILLAGRFFVAPLENRQFDMVIAALLFAGCSQMWRGRDFAAAGCLGASAAMKGTPLLFAPYLLWRGKLRAALVLVVVAVGLNVLPDLFWPQSTGRLYLADWYVSVLKELGRVPPGQWFSDVVLNQSLSGMANRFMQFGPPPSSADLTVPHGDVAQEGSGILRILVYGSGFLLVALTAWRFGRPGEAAAIVGATEPRPIPLKKLQTAMECAAIMCLMLLLSPMSSKSHYVIMVLPSMILARLAVERCSPWLIGVLVVLAITGPLTAKGLIGKTFGDWTLAWGFPTWFVFFSLVGTWLALGTLPRPPR